MLGFVPAQLVYDVGEAGATLHVGVDDEGHVLDGVGRVELGEPVLGDHPVGRCVFTYTGQTTEADE